MKTLVGMFWGMVAGLFLACAVIVFTHLIGAGADRLGFTEWTFRYYVLCLGACIALLLMSKPARQYWGLMLLFFVAVSMVIGVGFQDVFELGTGGDPSAQMLRNLQAIGALGAKLVMYVAPGGLTSFYALVAFGTVFQARGKATD